LQLVVVNVPKSKVSTGCPITLWGGHLMTIYKAGKLKIILFKRGVHSGLTPGNNFFH
jgi:hypothetical protein